MMALSEPAHNKIVKNEITHRKAAIAPLSVASKKGDQNLMVH